MPSEYQRITNDFFFSLLIKLVHEALAQHWFSRGGSTGKGAQWYILVIPVDQYVPTYELLIIIIIIYN